VDEDPIRAMPAPHSGLCAACTHARTVQSSKGSRFVLCERSLTDPAFLRYPSLPVLRCAGYTAQSTSNVDRGVRDP
jgi:hypothetical protein